MKELGPQRLSSVHLSGHLLQRAEQTVQHLERSKEDLLAKSGHPAYAFVDRYVEPILAPAREVVAAARSGTSVNISKWAVAGVEMVSLVQEESRLLWKIYEYCLEKTHDAVLEDMAFIISCPRELVSSSWVPSSEQPALIRRIEDGLQPLLQEFETLRARSPQSASLSDLFSWKYELDEERQRLHDLALEIIDTQIQQAAPLPAELESLSNEVASWPSVFELERTSTRLRELIETNAIDRADERLVEFFERMRGHVQHLVEDEEGDIHEAMLLQLKEHVRAIERLLGLSHSDPS